MLIDSNFFKIKERLGKKGNSFKFKTQTKINFNKTIFIKIIKI